MGMKLTEREHDLVVSILKRHLPEDCEVFFFGSRMDGTATSTSDLDILIKGNSSIELGTLALIKEGFEESDLPFNVDVLDYHNLSGKMMDNISRTLAKIM